MTFPAPQPPQGQYPTSKRRTLFSSPFAFSLIEVTLALGVAGFCLVTIMGLLPLGLNSNQNTLEQTLAASVASQIYSDLRVTPLTSGSSPRYQITIPAPTTTGTTAITALAKPLYVTADGSLATSSSNIQRFQVNISFISPSLPGQFSSSSTSGRPPGQSTLVRILVTWPPVASPANATGAFEAIDSLDRG